MSGRVRVANPVRFAASSTTSAMGLAKDCLEDGCSTGTVENLLDYLKAVKNPSPEVAKSISDLEALLGAEQPNKNELKSSIQGMFGTFEVLDETTAPPLIGLGGSKFKGGAPAGTISTIDLAKGCLDAGCPTDMTTELLTSLKAQEKPSAGVVKMIAELEALLKEERVNKNAVEKAVGNLVSSFGVADTGEATALPGGKGGFASSFAWKEQPSPLAPSTFKLATDCVEQGCPIDMTTELLAALKAEAKPTAEGQKMIEDLEELLAAEKPNKNQVENVVNNIMNSLIVVDKVVPPGLSGI